MEEIKFCQYCGSENVKTADVCIKCQKVLKINYWKISFICLITLVCIYLIGTNYSSIIDVTSSDIHENKRLLRVKASVGYYDLTIENIDDFTWRNCVFIANDTYKAYVDEIKMGQRSYIDLKTFSTENGVRFKASDFKIMKIDMACGDTPIGLLTNTLTWK